MAKTIYKHTARQAGRRERAGEAPLVLGLPHSGHHVNTYYEVSNETSLWFPGSAEGRVCSLVCAVYCAQGDKPTSNSTDPADHTHVSMYCTHRRDPVFAHVCRAGTWPCAHTLMHTNSQIPVLRTNAGEPSKLQSHKSDFRLIIEPDIDKLKSLWKGCFKFFRLIFVSTNHAAWGVDQYVMGDLEM